MVRTPQEDYLQNFRFRLFEVAGGAGVFINEAPIGGFNTITTPNVTIEVAEHRTGNETWTKKLPGVPTVGDGTMTRGVLLGNTTLYDWIIEKLLNRAPFRTDIEIHVYNQIQPGTQENDKFARREQWFNCFPSDVKPLADLDATSSDVNLEEVTVAVEEIGIETVDAVP